MSSPRSSYMRIPHGGDPLWDDDGAAGVILRSEFFGEAPAGTSGTLAAVESGSDSLAAAGGVSVSGSLTAAESGGDSLAASGGPRVAGAVTALESGQDALAAAGGTSVVGSIAAAEAGGDEFAAQGATDAPPTSAEPERGATGGGSSARGHRYRVRVGRRWVEVDPLDPLSVRAAYALAEEAAQEAAERPVASPRKSAVRVVRAEPVEAPSVDYAALRDEAQRVSEMVRAVYADALQRELIGRLMREQMERDDEDDIELLLTVM